MDIAQTKELIGEIINVLDEIRVKSVDGKLDLADILGLSDNALKLFNEGKDYDVIFEELQDLDEEEVRELANDLITIVFHLLAIVQNLG